MNGDSAVRFRRELLPEFVDDLAKGHLARLLAAAEEHGLDVQLRGECDQNDYISIYYRGYCALKLEARSRVRYTGRISTEFLRGTHLERATTSSTVGFRLADAETVAAYVEALPRILANIGQYPVGERHAEGCLYRDSHSPGSPVVFFDRQVAQTRVSIPDPDDTQDQIDLIGLLRGREHFIVGEVKYKEGGDIPSLPRKLPRYYAMFADAAGRLRGSMHTSYLRVVQQKRRLGLLPADFVFPATRPLVSCLVILCDYNDRCGDWAKAEQALRTGSVPVRVTRASPPDFAVPPLAGWAVVR